MKIYKDYRKRLTDRRNEKPENIKDNNLFTTTGALDIEIAPTIDENFEIIKKHLDGSIGLVVSKYFILDGKVPAGLAYIESIANKELINMHILLPLLKSNNAMNVDANATLLLLKSQLITASKTIIVTQLNQVIEGLLSGNTILFLNNAKAALLIDSRSLATRSIEKPSNEATVHGSKDSFVENLETNMSMVIRRLPVPTLRFKTYTAGSLSRTAVKLLWLEGIANPKIIEEADSRIKRINIDNVQGIGVLAELIEDRPISIFPKYRQTERPDVVARSLSDGHFAILCENSPFALVAPTMFWDHFKSMDDYSEPPLTASYLRLVRYLAFLISILISPLYLSFVTYNHAVTPPSLALNIAAGREGVPFPTVVELLLMTFALSLIREAGLRMPGSVGYFIGTLAAVLIGQAIVNAGYVSASLIIVVAISVISAFAISTTNLLYTSRLLNYFLIFLAGFLGMFGLINGIALTLWHLVSLRSFGVPYFYPLAPFDAAGMMDTFIRAPFSALKKRPRILAPFNRTRLGEK